MAYVITTSIVAGMPLQDSVMWNVLINAANVILVGAGAPKINWDPAISPSVGSFIATGTVIQDSNIFSCYYTVPYPQNDGIQTALSRLAGVSSGGGGSMPAMRSAAGLPTTLVRPVTSGVTDNSPWRRRRPREIYDITSIVDLQGNSFALNQYAYLTGTGVAGNWNGQLAKCTSITANPTGDPFGAANWTLTPNQKPDILDNTLDYPNTIAIDLHLFDAGMFGTVKNGDYLDVNVLEEIRRIILQF